MTAMGSFLLDAVKSNERDCTRHGLLYTYRPIGMLWTKLNASDMLVEYVSNRH